MEQPLRTRDDGYQRQCDFALPPVEYIHTGASKSEKSIRLPDAIIASVHWTISRLFMPLRIAIASAHLLVGDDAAGIGIDDPVDLFVGEPRLSRLAIMMSTERKPRSCGVGGSRGRSSPPAIVVQCDFDLHLTVKLRNDSAVIHHQDSIR